MSIRAWIGTAPLLAVLLGTGVGSCQTPEPARITFHFVRPGVQVPEYTLVLREDGSGTYDGTEVQQQSGSEAGSYVERNARKVPEHFSAPFTLSSALTARVFQEMRDSHLDGKCASHAKNIADTGSKTLSYTDPEGSRTCTYNYTQNKDLLRVTDTLQGMSYTLNAGRSMAKDEQYDRLGLDGEMNALVAALKDGRAQDPGLIAPELRSLLRDDQVMERVRRNAAMLLDKASLAH